MSSALARAPAFSIASSAPSAIGVPRASSIRHKDRATEAEKHRAKSRRLSCVRLANSSSAPARSIAGRAKAPPADGCRLGIPMFGWPLSSPYENVSETRRAVYNDLPSPRLRPLGFNPAAGRARKASRHHSTTPPPRPVLVKRRPTSIGGSEPNQHFLGVGTPARRSNPPR